MTVFELLIFSSILKKIIQKLDFGKTAFSIQRLV